MLPHIQLASLTLSNCAVRPRSCAAETRPCTAQTPAPKVMAVARNVTQQILFHPEQIHHQAKRPRCFCKVKNESNMALCESCGQWYHFGCLGVTEQEIEAANDWKCGYCVGKPGVDGMCEWKMAILQGNRKRKKVARRASLMTRRSPVAPGTTPSLRRELEEKRLMAK